MTTISEQGGQAERRAERRRRALKGATLTFNKGYGALECTVRDVSDRGARLHFGETSAVPPRFALRLGREGDARPAIVRWRSLTDIGVRFEDA